MRMQPIAAGLALRHASVTVIHWLHADPTEASKDRPIFPYTRPYPPLLPQIFCT